jgi:hypothetical protein
LPNDLGVLNLDHLLVDIFGVTHHILFRLFEGVDGCSAFFDVLIDRQREPVMILRSLVHMLVKFFDVVSQKSSLNWSKIADS